MAEMVASAVVQEGVSRAISFFLDKREAKLPQEHSIERLEMAISELELALERSAKLRITDVSLLRRRKVFKRAYIEGTDLLIKHKQQQAPVDAAVLLQQGVTTHSSSPGCITHHARKSKISIVFSSLLGMRKEERCLSSSDLRRFEWFADSARNFLRDVESGCSLRHHMFCSPLVRHLLDGKTFRHEIVQGTQRQYFALRPMCCEERGVEATLMHSHKDCNAPEQNFSMSLRLRLSESTDIVGIATKCLLVLLASPQFKNAAQSATGGLTLLANLQDISHSYDPDHWAYHLMHTLATKALRRDPFCCEANGHRPSANNSIATGLSHLLPEQVIDFSFDCCIPAMEHSSRRVETRSTMGDRRPPLEVAVHFWPHYFSGYRVPESCHAVETVGDNEEIRYASLEEVAEMAGSQAISCFSRQPELSSYEINWYSVHGVAFFTVKKPITQGPGAKRRRR